MKPMKNLNKSQSRFMISKRTALAVAIGCLGMVACNNGGSGGYGGTTGQMATGDVIAKIPQGASSLGSGGFGTSPLVISHGIRVTWDNTDGSPHTVTATDGSFDSGTLNGGEGVYSHVFSTPGSYEIHSTASGDQGMTQEIQVTN